MNTRTCKVVGVLVAVLVAVVITLFTAASRRQSAAAQTKPQPQPPAPAAAKASKPVAAANELEDRLGALGLTTQGGFTVAATRTQQGGEQ